MARGPLWLLLLLVALAPWREAVASYRDEQLATVKIDARMGNGHTCGSGVLIHQNGSTLHVLSCAHGLDGKRYPVCSVRLPTGEHLQGRIVAIDEQLDLSLIQTSINKSVPTLQIGPQPTPGTFVESFGYPESSMRAGFKRNHLQIRKTGRVLPTVMERGLYSHWSLRPEQGDSGGPVVHNGRVVGLLNLSHNTTGVGAGPNSHAIQKFFNEKCLRLFRRGQHAQQSGGS